VKRLRRRRWRRRRGWRRERREEEEGGGGGEGLFKADAVNEEKSGRIRATPAEVKEAE